MALVRPQTRDRWTEIAGLFGSAAETVSIACAAEVEAVLLEGALADGALPEAFGICRRAVGESECYFLLAAANTVVNLSVRMLMLSDD